MCVGSYVGIDETNLGKYLYNCINDEKINQFKKVGQTTKGTRRIPRC